MYPYEITEMETEHLLAMYARKGAEESAEKMLDSTYTNTWDVATAIFRAAIAHEREGNTLTKSAKRCRFNDAKQLALTYANAAGSAYKMARRWYNKLLNYARRYDLDTYERMSKDCLSRLKDKLRMLALMYVRGSIAGMPRTVRHNSPHIHSRMNTLEAKASDRYWDLKRTRGRYGREMPMA